MAVERENRMNKMITVVSALAVLGIGSLRADAHCQIPCGIYDDNLRFTLMEEHITTIEKSMKEITRLSAEKAVDCNQVVRWVQNKDKHADNLSEIATSYFMAQRVAPADEKNAKKYEKYVREITQLHQILYHAMKAKQTTGLEEIAKLRELLKQFQATYLEKQPEK